MSYQVNTIDLTTGHVTHLSTFGYKDRAFEVMESCLLKNTADTVVTIRDTGKNEYIAREHCYLPA